MTYEVDLNGPWKLYSPIVPAGFMVHGTITRQTGDTGALFQNGKTGVFVQANAGIFRALYGRDVMLALTRALAEENTL